MGISLHSYDNELQAKYANTQNNEMAKSVRNWLTAIDLFCLIRTW